MATLFRKEKVVGKVILLPVEDIVPNPSQPRKEFDFYELSGLAESIKANGILQPLTVRRKEEHYELIAGERRLRASKMAGLSSVPCIIEEKSDADSAVLALLENIQRADLNYFEQAVAIEKLMILEGLGQEQMAKRLGMAQSTLANKIRLLRLAPELRSLILEHRLTERHARALLKLEGPEKQRDALELIVKRGLNVSQAEALITELGSEQKQKKERRFIVKDVRIFINTVSKAVEMMRTSGIQADAKKREDAEFIEYTIRIPKTQAIRMNRTA